MLDLQDLNPAQRAAVEHVGGPLMIIAGAGTGKTRVITYRIAFLHRHVGIPLNQILAVTFTNKAAREMRERVCRLLDVADTPGLAIGTFHSRCAVLLRREAEAAGLDPNFAILDETDQLQAIKRVMKELNVSEKRVRPAQVQQFINQAKMRLLTSEDCRAELDEEEIPYVDLYERYQVTIDRAKSIDFEDLIMRTVRLFQSNEPVRQRWANRYRYVLVDEYQDTNHGQFLLTKLLAQDHKQIAVVGDEDQSIYSWRGAEIKNLLDFEKTFPDTRLVKLEHNYRSTGNILKAAGTVIAHNTQRIGKELFTEESEGEPLGFHAARDQDEEALWIAQECTRLLTVEGVSAAEVAIFYRGHWLSRSVEDALRRYRLPYRIVGGLRFYDRKEIKDLLSFLRLAVNPEDDLAFERVINTPARGIGPKALEAIEVAAQRAGTSRLAAARALLQAGEFKGTARRGVETFVEAVEQWFKMAEGRASALDVLERVLLDTNYENDGVGDPKSIEGESRLENIAEFKGLLADFKPTQPERALAEFLTSMALDSSEQTKDDGTPKINLLTIHNAKGLEFLHVFCIGLEKGVFPTSRAEESFDEYAIEEERRLFYVAVTRARRKLWLCYSAKRNRPDMWNQMEPSRFVGELPTDVFDSGSLTALKKLFPHRFPSQRRTGHDAGRTVEYDSDVRASGGMFRPARGAASPPRPGRSGEGGTKFRVGDRVLHRYMGPGTISELGGRPGWERAVIDFDDGRSQEFVLKYAPITPTS